MADRTEVYVLTSPQVAEILARAPVSLEELLRREGVDVVQTYGDDPVRKPGATEREPVTLLIIATAAAVAALAPALSRVLGMLTHQPIVAVEKVCEPILDENGKPVLDAAGAPLLRWIERTRPVTLNVDVKALGIEIAVGERTEAAPK